MAPELDSAAFPDDAASLRALLAERDAAIAERDAALVEREAALAERDAHLRNVRLEIEKLKVQLAALRRDRYGKSSERLAAEIGQLEMLIGDLEEDQAERDAAAAEKTRKAKGKPDKPRKPALRRPLPEHLPRETVLHEPVLACRCGCADPTRLARIGEDVTEVLARLKVIRHVRPRCARCSRSPRRRWWSAMRGCWTPRSRSRSCRSSSRRCGATATASPPSGSPPRSASSRC